MTFAEINRTVMENIRPVVSKIIGNVIWVELVIIIVHSIINVLLRNKDQRTKGVIKITDIHRSLLKNIGVDLRSIA